MFLSLLCLYESNMLFNFAAFNFFVAINLTLAIFAALFSCWFCYQIAAFLKDLLFSNFVENVCTANIWCILTESTIMFLK